MPSVRAARASDLRAIAALFSERDHARVSEASVSRRLHGLDAARCDAVIAHEGDTLLGFSAVEYRDLADGRRSHRAAYWRDLYVSATARNLGLYVPLARATLAAAESGKAALTYTANRRREVWEAHQKIGFRIVGVFDVLGRPVSPTRSLVRAGTSDMASPGARAGVLARAAAPFGPLLRGVDAVTRAVYERAVRLPNAARSAEVDLPNLDADALRRVARLGTRRRRGYASVDVRHLGERLAQAPTGHHYRVAFATGGGGDLAAALVAFGPRGPMHVGALLDIFAADPTEIHQGLEAAFVLAGSEAAAVLLALDGAEDLSAALAANGFARTPERYVLLVHPHGALDDTLLLSTRYRFPFLEHDAF